MESLKVNDTAGNQIDSLRQQLDIESSRAESLEKQKKSMQETIASLAEREVRSGGRCLTVSGDLSASSFTEKFAERIGQPKNIAQIILSKSNRGSRTAESQRIPEAIRSGRGII